LLKRFEMPEVVVQRTQTNRVTILGRKDRASERTIFNPIRITGNEQRNTTTPRCGVVISERTVKELDTARMISGETPTPAANGVVLIFTTAYPYVAGTLHVTRASLRMHPTADYTETSPSAGTFTMVIAPDTLEPLVVDYVKA
jgi:hypothetical protein